MKKLYSLLIILCVFAISCKKDSMARSGITIKYYFKAKEVGNYIVNYMDITSTNKSVIFTGNNWSKSFNVVNKNEFKTATFAVGRTGGYLRTKCTAAIYVNNVQKAKSDFTITPSLPMVSVCYLLAF